MAAALSFAGMAWLAMAMPVHWAQVRNVHVREAGGTRRGLQLLGAAALTLSLCACLMADSPAMATLVWVMLMAAAAPGVAMLLARRPRWLRLLWPRG
ncbi:MAG: DUF3325 domain-containing protein [Acidovorax sp.]